MNADMAKGQSELAAIASGKAAESEAQAKHAAGEAAAAKDRLNKLAKGEDVAGGVGNPRTREDFERILMDAGWSPDDIRFSVALAGLRGDEEFEAFLTQSFELRERTEKSTRWKVLSKIVAKRSYIDEDNDGPGGK
jgi:hypothetical protein